MGGQQSSDSDMVDGIICSAIAQETETQRSANIDEQLSRNKFVQPKSNNNNRRVDSDGAMCSEQKQSKTIMMMHSSEKIDDKMIDTMIVSAAFNTDDGGNNNERKHTSTTNRQKATNCDNFDAYEMNERRYGEASVAVAANEGGGGGISSDSGVGFDVCLDDDDTDDDPYAELEFYLEKVKVSVFAGIFYFLYTNDCEGAAIC